MRHRVYGKHLGRDKNQRLALFRGLVGSLILHESIQTTQAKAKAIKGLVDTLIVKSKQDSNAARSALESFFQQPKVLEKLTQDVSKRYNSRNSGFTQIVRLGTRAGDGAMMVKMSLIGADEAKVTPKAQVAEKEVEKEALETKKASPKKAKKKA